MGGPLILHLRAEARRRWPAWLAVVVVIGVVGGIVLGTLAGARRTATAFDRMVEENETSEVMVNPDYGMFSGLDPTDVAALPGVVRTGIIEGGGGIIVGADGSLDGATQVFVQRDPGVMVDFERPRIVAGRLFDPRDPSGAIVTDDVAVKHGLEVGDRFTIGTMTMEELDAWEQAGEPQPPPLTLHEQRVDAVVVSADGVVTDEVYHYGRVVLPHAFGVEHRPASYYYGIFVDLEDGDAAVAPLMERIRTLVPGEQFEAKTLAATEEGVDRGARPHVIALLAFAVLVGFAGTVVSGQAVTRQLAPVLAEDRTLLAVGLGRRDLRRATLLRSCALAVPGAALAVVVAVAISPLFPVGVASRAEIDPGVSVDLQVLVPATFVLVTTLLVWPAAATRRLRGSTRSVRAPGALERVARVTDRPVVATGLRAALTAPSARSEASPRGALAGLVVAVGAVATALTFGAGLRHLVERPAAYGWAWDAMVAPPGDEDYGPVVRDRIDGAPEFTGWMELTVDQLRVGSARIPAVGMDTGSDGPAPTIAAGRLPSDAGEIALGGRTMDLLGVDLGDRLEVGEHPSTAALTVVGQAVFPGLGTYSGADRTELGKGALLDRVTLAEVGEGFDASFIGIRAADRPSLDAGLARVTDGFDAAIEEGEIEVFDQPQRPSDIRSLESVRRTPEVVAAALALLAGIALSFVLVSGVRSRRRELTLLRTFGFRRRDLAATVVCQSLVTGLLALTIGIPIGVVAGRLTWAALAESVGVAPEPQVPWSLLVVAAGVLALAVLVALVPAAMAGRVRPAHALRSE